MIESVKIDELIMKRSPRERLGLRWNARGHLHLEEEEQRVSEKK